MLLAAQGILNARWFLPSLHSMRNTSVSFGKLLLLLIFFEESILIGLAIARGLVKADLVYPNVGAALGCFERTMATQISGVAGDDFAGKTRLMHLPEANNNFRKASGEVRRCFVNSSWLIGHTMSCKINTSTEWVYTRQNYHKGSMNIPQPNIEGSTVHCLIEVEHVIWCEAVIWCAHRPFPPLLDLWSDGLQPWMQIIVIIIKVSKKNPNY